MTEMRQEVPPWTLGWRLQRALSWADVSVEQIARELEVSRSTVSGWLNDRHAPRAIYVREWANRCRVPLDWLVEGDLVLPRGDSNTQPADDDDDLRISAGLPGYSEVASELHAFRKAVPLEGTRLHQSSDYAERIR